MKDQAETAISDEAFSKAAERWPQDVPTTKEAYYIRQIFDGLYPSEAAASTAVRSVLSLLHFFKPLFHLSLLVNLIIIALSLSLPQFSSLLVSVCSARRRSSRNISLSYIFSSITTYVPPVFFFFGAIPSPPYFCIACCAVKPPPRLHGQFRYCF